MEFNEIHKKIQILNERAKKYIVEDYDDDDEDYDYDAVGDDGLTEWMRDDLLSKYNEIYFTPVLPEDDKINCPVYTGRQITWFGREGSSIVVPIEYVYSREDNVFHDEKQEFLNELIEIYDKNIELIPGYAMIHVSDIDYIREGKIYESTAGPVLDTSGDENLDNYIGLEEAYLLGEFLNTSIDDSFIEFLFEFHLKIYNQTVSLIEFKNTIKSKAIELDVDLDEVEEVVNNFLDYEESVAEAVSNKSGTIDKILFQMRDGNHRFQAAKNCGEDYIMIIVEENTIQKKGVEFFEKYGYTFH